MAIARWKDLCIDATDAPRAAAFWGELLGLAVELDDVGDAVLRGEVPQQTIWINTVPEPRTVKQRVHLDVESGDVTKVLALGATMVLPADESGFAWSVLADPEGGELCVFERHGFAEHPPARLHAMVVDCADSAASHAFSTWWADVLGGRVADDGRAYWWIEDVPGLPFDTIDAVPVPEPKTVKNRIHWDITSDDLAGLRARGAGVLAEPTTATPWHVMADPQGNEFCVFPP